MVRDRDRNMEGSLTWRGVSGVPGLGCSVSHCGEDSLVLELWEEGRYEIKDKLTVNDKLVKFFSFRRKKSTQPTLSFSEYSSVSLPKVSVRRSVSAITTSHRTKVFPLSRDESFQKLAIINSKSDIRRSVSFKNEKINQKENVDLQSVSETSKESLMESDVQNSPLTQSFYLSSINLSKSGHSRLLRSSKKRDAKEKLKQSGVLKNETKEATKKCQATQTYLFENDKYHDYVYSNFISPAMLIKLSEHLEEKNEEEENIYEEIVPKERKICRANSMFLSISEHRRKQLQMNKFAGWDLVLRDSVDKNNYIRPQTVKEELEKKIIHQNNDCKKRSKGNRNVTFAVDGKNLQRSKSVKETSRLVLHSDL